MTGQQHSHRAVVHVGKPDLLPNSFRRAVESFPQRRRKGERQRLFIPTEPSVAHMLQEVRAKGMEASMFCPPTTTLLLCCEPVSLSASSSSLLFSIAFVEVHFL